MKDEHANPNAALAMSLRLVAEWKKPPLADERKLESEVTQLTSYDVKVASYEQIKDDECGVR